MNSAKASRLPCVRMTDAALPSLEEVAGADFRTAIATIAPRICAALERDDPAVGPVLGEMLRKSDGVRGFFVHYLTDPSLEKPDAPEPPTALVAAMAGAPEAMLAELMVMNVIMPAATSLLHQRNGDIESLEGSRLTARRATALVSTVPVGPVRSDLYAVLAVCEDAGAPPAGVPEERMAFWAEFCDRWGYDEQQRTIIAAVVRALLDED